MTLDELSRLDRLVDEIEVAVALGFSRRTVQKWRQHGRGPRYLKQGEGKTAPVRYEPRAVVEWARANPGGVQ